MRESWSAVIINYNGAAFLGACIVALQQTSPPPTEIVVVDNASTDDSLLELSGFPRVNVMRLPRNLGFGAGANVGLGAVETPYALLMNPDVEVDRDFGAALLGAFGSDARLGVAGALLLFPQTTTVQHAGGVLEKPLMTTRHRGYREPAESIGPDSVDVDFVTGGCVALRTEAFHAVGGFDEQFSPVYYEDVDLCASLRDAGWRVRFVPALRAEHHEGSTLGRSDDYFRHFHRNRLRYALKHLSSVEWRRSFLPAEIERIRWDLGEEGANDWRAFSGADAIESLLTDGSEAGSTLGAVSPAALQTAVGELKAGWEVQRRRQGEGRLRRALTPWNRQIDRVIEDQRAFNGVIVRAFAQQDAMNRQQTAQLLLIALEIAERLRASGRPPADLPGLR